MKGSTMKKIQFYKFPNYGVNHRIKTIGITFAVYDNLQYVEIEILKLRYRISIARKSRRIKDMPMKSY
jgi:hypothetical protein